MNKLINLYKESTFLQGFVSAIIFTFSIAISFVTILSFIIFPMFIIDNTGWWSIILVPLYIGTIGGIIFVLDDKFEFL